MLLSIANAQLSAKIDTHGAELKSLKMQANGMEFLWQGDPAVWADSAPFLFPVVARQLDDFYVLDGQTYTMPMHGFAKDSDFELVETTDRSLTLSLGANETTCKWYPFQFKLITSFMLVDSLLEVRHEVENRGSVDMPFSIGEHPGFRVPMSEGDVLSDYYLEFSASENAERWYLDDEIICGSEPYLSGNKILITASIFDRGALIFKHLQSDNVVLRSKNHEHSITMDLRGWEYLGIWAKPGANYVCIEPWNGLASSKWSSHDIWKKEGIRRLAPGQKECFTMRIGVK